MNWFLRRKKKNQEKVDEKTFMMSNGKILLEKLITSCDGKRNPIRNFSAKELKIATNNYNGHPVIAFGHYKLYKGFLEHRPISVMKFRDYYSNGGEFSFNNIVFAAQMSHKNILKLIGCCLETEIPTLVFESVEYGTLADRIHGPHGPHLEPLLWTHRLKIAMEIAYAMAYIHIGFHRPIVFKDIKLSKILFDEHNVAKLSDFSESEYIPEDETHVTSHMLTRTNRYFPPEYILTGLCNEKTDVFGFGMLLLEVLTGRKDHFLLDPVKNNIGNIRLGEIVDPILVEDKSCPGKEQQLQALVQLIMKCVNESVGDRPTMVDVAKQLRQMYLSTV